MQHFFFFSFFSEAWGGNLDQTPTEAIQEVEKRFNSYYTGSNLTIQQKKYNESLKKRILHETFDIYELCRLALDLHWNERTPEEQDNFVDLMTKLLEKRTIFAKEHAKERGKEAYKTLYQGDEFLNPEESLALTKTKVFVPDKKLDLNINYQMKKLEQPEFLDDYWYDNEKPITWKIFDVVVDESSLIENYKYQFDRIITEYGYQDLIQRMEEKYQQLVGKKIADN